MRTTRPIVGLVTVDEDLQVGHNVPALQLWDRRELSVENVLVNRGAAVAGAENTGLGERFTPLLEAPIVELEGAGATLTALLCTGAFGRLAATRPLVQPQPILLGVLRAMSWPGRLGILTPSAPHVPQTEARWRADGFDPVVVPLSPYEEDDPAAVARAADALRAARAGLVVLDCMGFRKKTRDELQAATGAPALVANLLVARVLAELCGV